MAFITVKFGDDEKELFNPNCVTLNLLDNIRRRCRCQRGVTLDLSDEEGELKNLPDFPMQYAHKFLKPRDTFVLVKIEKGPDGPTTYTALLNDVENSNPKLLARLEALSRSATEGKPKSGQNKKESFWNAAKRKTARGSAGRSRTDTIPGKTDNKTTGATPSPQGKPRQRKLTRS